MSYPYVIATYDKLVDATILGLRYAMSAILRAHMTDRPCLDSSDKY